MEEGPVTGPSSVSSPVVEDIDQGRRSVLRRLGTWLAGVGVLLAIAAGVSLLSLSDSDAGDAASIEASLTDHPPTSVTVATMTEAPPPEQIETGVVPLWSANGSSLLTDLANAKVPTPVALRIDALGVDAPINGYGINQRTGQMDVPGNVRDVGWYEHGPVPGQPGSAVLAAHVDLESRGPGVFFDLKRLEPGDLITVSYDDGSELWFEVEARSTYEKEDLPLDAIFSRDGASVLTLVTCGGGFSASERSYDSNVVVYATPVKRPSGSVPAS